MLDDKRKVVGSFATTRPSNEKLEQYLKDHDYSQLDNDISNENEYVFSLALGKEHRHANAIKILGGSYAEQLINYDRRGIKTTRVVSEAVSNDGHKSLTKMGMQEVTDIAIENMKMPFSDDYDLGLDDDGLGFHYSPDNLDDYKINMSTWKKNNHSNYRVIQCVLDKKNKLKQFGADVKSGKTKDDFVNWAKGKNTQRAAMLFGAEYGLAGLGVFSTMSGHGNIGWYAANVIPALIDGLAVAFASTKNKQPFTKQSVKSAIKINAAITTVAFGLGAYLGQKTGNLDMANVIKGALAGAGTSAAVTFGLGSVLINREHKKAQQKQSQDDDTNMK